MAGVGSLSDDLLCHVFQLVIDSTQLRVISGTCRRWAALLRNRHELWESVSFALPPKRSRGRDRWAGEGCRGRERARR
jgi:hypothetical protein